MASFIDLQTIAGDSEFQGRCMYALHVTAVNVMGEDPSTANHAQRVTFATQVINGGLSAYNVAMVVLTANLTSSEATTGSLPGCTAIPDADIQTIITDNFNALAGIATS